MENHKEYEPAKNEVPPCLYVCLASYKRKSRVIAYRLRHCSVKSNANMRISLQLLSCMFRTVGCSNSKKPLISEGLNGNRVDSTDLSHKPR